MSDAGDRTGINWGPPGENDPDMGQPVAWPREPPLWLPMIRLNLPQPEDMPAWRAAVDELGDIQVWRRRMFANMSLIDDGAHADAISKDEDERRDYYCVQPHTAAWRAQTRKLRMKLFASLPGVIQDDYLVNRALIACNLGVDLFDAVNECYRLLRAVRVSVVSHSLCFSYEAVFPCHRSLADAPRRRAPTTGVPEMHLKPMTCLERNAGQVAEHLGGAGWG
jgi:hypothetical protein